MRSEKTKPRQRAVTYQFTGYSQSGLFFTGELRVDDDTPLDRVAIKVAHECARRSISAGYLWDPFNLQIAIKRKRKLRRASHK
jgi:hypothetical protein